MISRKKINVYVAMSGGVDSSVAALLCKKAGYNVTGVYMKNWSDPLSDACLWKNDIADFKAVCKKIGIPYKIENFEEEYRRKVVRYLIDGYKKGLTPNPDMLCNREIKFRLFLDKARRSGADYIATGHYAINKTDARDIHHLYQAKDANKDQSYFLSLLNQKQLRYSMFPIGNFTKPYVRSLARKAGLPVYNKPDSQGICFVGKVKFKDFMKQFIASKPGLVVTLEGKPIGHHDGLAYYTIGQRHGLGIGGGTPYYVTRKDVKKNILYVSTEKKLTDLSSRTLFAKNLSWVSTVTLRLPFSCQARIRYRQPLQHCRISRSGKDLKVDFQKPQRAVTPGQFVVFYHRHEVLGGGVIT